MTFPRRLGNRPDFALSANPLPPSDVSSNGPQDAAIPDKHQIELVTIPRVGTDMDKRTKRANPLRENEKPTLLTRQQIILASGVAMAGTIPFWPGDIRAVVASRR
jgi:hypothetical protein